MLDDYFATVIWKYSVDFLHIFMKAVSIYHHISTQTAYLPVPCITT